MVNKETKIPDWIKANPNLLKNPEMLKNGELDNKKHNLLTNNFIIHVIPEKE